MSNKPRKHSESTNSWRGAQRSSYRAYKVQMERHLIVCEGTKTEPLYFTELKRALGPNNGRKIYIEPIGTGAHTTGLLELAQDVCNSSFEEYSHVWLVYDLDDFSKEDFDQVARRCKEISGKVDYHALWSNPCFEVWLLLHFGFTSAAMNSQECIKRLNDVWEKEFGERYNKNANGLFAETKDRMDCALQACSQLRDYHLGINNMSPSIMNPQTNMPEFIEVVKDYITD